MFDTVYALYFHVIQLFDYFADQFNEIFDQF